jgi:hypothetical protein
MASADMALEDNAAAPRRGRFDGGSSSAVKSVDDGGDKAAASEARCDGGRAVSDGEEELRAAS